MAASRLIFFPLALVSVRCQEAVVTAGTLNRWEIVYNVTTKTERAVGLFNANWPCIYGAEPVMSGRSCSRKSMRWYARHNRPAGGCEWKWLCGIRALQAPCVVYSFGSHNETSFEQGLRRLKPACEVHIFDPFILPNKNYARALGVHVHDVGISNVDEIWPVGAPKCGWKRRPCAKAIRMETLDTIMRRLGHSYIDVLKMDVEGAEGIALEAMREQGALSRVGMINVEIHGMVNKRHVLESLEADGFRLWKAEPNIALLPVAGPKRVSWEYGLIHKHYRPNRHSNSPEMAKVPRVDKAGKDATKAVDPPFDGWRFRRPSIEDDKNPRQRRRSRPIYSPIRRTDRKQSRDSETL